MSFIKYFESFLHESADLFSYEIKSQKRFMTKDDHMIFYLNKAKTYYRTAQNRLAKQKNENS
jgi:hypothetical protein